MKSLTAVLLVIVLPAASQGPIPTPRKDRQVEQPYASAAAQEGRAYYKAPQTAPLWLKDITPRTQGEESEDGKKSNEKAPENRTVEIVSIALTAIATVVIAWFNFSLSHSTKQLWREARVARRIALRNVRAARASAEAAQASADAMRDEFMSTHRPRLRVKHVVLTSEIWDGEEIEIKLIIVNAGNTHARIIECSVVTVAVPKGRELPGRPEYPFNSRFKPAAETLPSGKTYIFPRLKRGHVLTDADNTGLRNGSLSLYRYGFVEYLDLGVSPRLKTTAFCRVLVVPMRPTSYVDIGRFVLHIDPDYEYAD